MLMLLIYFSLLQWTFIRKRCDAHYYQYHVKIIQGLYLVLHRENYIHLVSAMEKYDAHAYKDEDIHLQDISENRIKHIIKSCKES